MDHVFVAVEDEIEELHKKMLVVYAEIRNKGAPSMVDNYEISIEGVPVEIQSYGQKVTLKQDNWEQPIYEEDWLPR